MSDDIWFQPLELSEEESRRLDESIERNELLLQTVFAGLGIPAEMVRGTDSCGGPNN